MGAPLHGQKPVLTGYLSYAEQVGSKDNKWAPFLSEVDWKVAQWAKLCGPSATAFSEFLKIPGVCMH